MVLGEPFVRQRLLRVSLASRTRRRDVSRAANDRDSRRQVVYPDVVRSGVEPPTLYHRATMTSATASPASITRNFTYAPSLDGARAVAALAVVAMHAGVPVQGDVGVYLFFAISGFLITSLLLEEHRATGSINLRRFFARRALRLFPALAVVVVAGSLLAQFVVQPWSEPTKDGMLPAALYYANWFRGIEGLGSLGLFEHTWSLAIEEQFYLVWPAVVVLSLRVTRRVTGIAAIALTGCLGALVWRLLLIENSGSASRVLNGTDTNADHLLWGSGLAVLLFLVRRSGRHDLVRVVLTTAFWPAVAVASWWFVAPQLDLTSTDRAIALSALAVSCTVIVGHLFTSEGWVARALASAPLRWIGVRSYGLYLWHFPAMMIIVESQAIESSVLRLLAKLAASFALAALSYELIERPFLRLKTRFRSLPAPETDAGPIPPVGGRG